MARRLTTGVVVAVGCAASLAVATALYLQGNDSSQKSGPQSERRQGTAKLKFENDAYDAGTQWVGQSDLRPAYSYRFENVSEAPVKITKHVVSCPSCLALKYPTDPIPP